MKDRYAIKEGWQGAGLFCTVIGKVHHGQDWAVVVWDTHNPGGETDIEDPDLFKLAGLEPFPAGVKCLSCADTGDVVVGYDPEARPQFKLGACPNCDGGDVVAKWNKTVPIGTPVTVRKDDNSILRTRTKSKAWKMPSGMAVIQVDEIAGCYLLDRVKTIPEPTEEEVREAVQHDIIETSHGV